MAAAANDSSSFVSWLRTLVGCFKNVIFGTENQNPASGLLSRRSRRGALAGLTFFDGHEFVYFTNP